MTVKKANLRAFVFLSFFLTILGGAAFAQEGKQLMIVVTTDDNGEVNPCG